jgi:hypothetical protein
MKIKLLIWFLLTGLWHVQAQIVKHIEIKWNIPHNFPETAQPAGVWLFQPENYHYDGKNIYFVFDTLNVYGNPASLKITNVKYAPFPKNWAENFLGLNKEKSFKASLYPHKGRNTYGTTFIINAVKYENGIWYKLEAFDLNFQTDLPRSVQRTTNIRHSPFATGDWYKIEVNKTGIYKIDRNFLSDLGINVNQIDPRNIKIYGWGGRMLPLKNTSDYPLLMPELAIEVVGGQDGSFDSGDYILFYAVGKQKWNPEYQTYNNIYTDKAYYFINISPGNGKRISVRSQPPASPVMTFNTYFAERFYEHDSLNIVKLGREWYGGNFNTGNATLQLSFDFENIDTGQPAFFSYKVASVNKVSGTVTLKINNVLTDVMTLQPVSYHVLATSAQKSGPFNLTGNNVDITLTYNDGGYGPAKVFLDFIKIGAYQFLQVNGKSFAFYHPSQHTATGIVRYDLTHASNLRAVWDITDPFNIQKIENPGNNTFSFKAEPGVKYYHTVGTEFHRPRIPDNSKLSNSDLAYETFFPNGSLEEPDYIIIAPKAFETQAMRLVQFHQNNGLKAFFAPLEKIYLEFGNGTQDVAAIRNYIRYVYLNASSPATRIKYITLLGDTSWDFKQKQYPDLEENFNVIPSYQSQYSFSLNGSFVTDDFFVCMDDGEGYMDHVYSNTPDIAIGRIPVSTPGQASEVVDKLLSYYNPDTFGAWHNTVTLIADDADSNQNSWELGLINTTLNISDKIYSYHPHFNQNKIYLDAYKQEITSGGARYPDAKRDLLNSFEKGTLILNFIGHGNEYSWTHERILNLPEIKTLRNKNKLPFISTITCEFGRFDNPKLYSGAELFLLNTQGGSFGMITTVREVSASSAMSINKIIYNYLFGMESAGFTQFRTPGEALMLSKQSNTGINNKVCFLGDPAMKLHFAEPEIVITRLTGSTNDTVKALQHIRIEGEIQDGNGNLLTAFNGKLYPVIFDKNIISRSLNNDNVTGQNFTFEKLGPVIFKGTTDVSGGRFAFEFVVPKDIRPNYGYGRISFYANREQNTRQGVDTTYVFGGIDANAPEDNTPPEIKLYMNDYNFSDGGITGPNPFLLVDLYDENGINTVGGVGHDIVAVLDDSAESTFILNDYYVADNNTYKSGKIKFKLYGLSPGEHVIRVKAWDVYNNASEAEIRFKVVEKKELEITRVLNYPNPFIDYTEFWFSHNRPFETLDVQILVYSATGKLVWSAYRQIETEGYTSREIKWNGLDHYGQRIGKGVYFYKLSVRTQDGKKVEKWEKLVKL